MIIDAIKTYVKTCPLLAAKGTINVNYLGKEPCKYAIENIPANPVVKKYTDGGELRQFLFALVSRECYDANALENMNVAQFFEDFEKWITEQDDSGIFPILSDTKLHPTKIEVTSSGYLSSADATTARFAIELKLTYKRER